MIRKYWGLLLISILTVWIISSCTAKKTLSTSLAPQPTLAPITITIWHHWSGNSLNTLQAIFNRYMSEHTNVTIVLDAPQDMQSSLQLTIPSAIGPDIIGWGNDAIGSFATKGYIVDLGTLGVTQDFLTTTYEPAAANGVVWQGKIWALPESQNAIAIVYNKALVNEANFPKDPMDFAELLAKAKAYAESNPGKYLVCNQGLGSADAYYAAPIYFGFGVPSYVDDAGKAYLNIPQAIQAGNWIKEFSAFAPKEASYDICNSGITDGTFASWWTDSSSIANFEKAGIDYGILPMGKPFVAIDVLMITSNAYNRGNNATALDIIKYLTNHINETQLALANKTVPATTASINDPEVQAMTLIKGFSTAAKLGIAVPNTPYANAEWGPVSDATLAIWNGSQTPDAALAAAQTAIESSIARMK